MADPKKGEETAEAPATDAPPSESEEQKLETPADQPEDQEKAPEQKSPESETGTNEVGEEEKPPKDNAAWAKMRAENRRLKEVVSSVDPAYLESLQGAVQPQGETQTTVPQFQGDADYPQVVQGVNWANAQAARANQQVTRLQNQLELQQDREAERAFPELKTDKVFQQIVAEKKLAARVLGHDRTTLEIAEEVSRLLNKREEQVAAKTAQETKEQILERQAISSEPKGQTTGGRSGAANEELRKRVRMGDQSAQEEVAKSIIADLEF